MKILILENDKTLWKNLKNFLQENSFIVNLISTWNLWLKDALKNKYDIFIFNTFLPEKSWFDITKKIRQENINTPVIFLSDNDNFDDKEKWFMVWWDDYLIKPFKLKELVLRIRSILKRTNNIQEINKIIIWDIELNLDLKEVTRWWKKIILTPKEFIILEYLMKNKNKVIPKHELLEYIWWINNDIWSDVVRTHIQSLRKKINNWFSYDPIITIRGIWFMFEEIIK